MYQGVPLESQVCHHNIDFICSFFFVALALARLVLPIAEVLIIVVSIIDSVCPLQDCIDFVLGLAFLVVFSFEAVGEL